MVTARTSVELIGGAIEAYERFIRSRVPDVGDPELGVAQAYECGRRALVARARAEAWPIPDPVSRRVAELEDALARAAPDDALGWLDCFPHTVLGALERRHSGADDPPGPRRRFMDEIRRGRESR